MEITISEIVKDDIIILQQLFLSVRQQTFVWLDTSFYQLTDFNEETKGELILVAKCDDKIAGFISVWTPDAFIHHLYIKKEYQGAGIGTALLKEVKNRFSVSIRLKCLKDNKVAIDFYKKNEFKEKETGIGDNGEFGVFEYSRS
jgi:ribosomal protein S18 acetylase RimI-like enzyme